MQHRLQFHHYKNAIHNLCGHIVANHLTLPQLMKAIIIRIVRKEHTKCIDILLPISVHRLPILEKSFSNSIKA